MTSLDALVICASAIGGGLGGLRWLRVAQREHYLPGATTRFAVRWWTVDPRNVLLAVVALAGAVACGFVAPAGFATAAVVAVAPIGLSLRGRTAKLVWTRRLRTIAALVVAEFSLAGLAGGLAGSGLAAAVVVTACAAGMSALVDLALVVDAPIERLLAERYVRQANERLARTKPVVVAITGSYGKTSTKHFVAHLVGGTKPVVASPHSFNNRAGLARAINETLAAGTEVFVAEMGAYRPGEIAELVRWLRPRISAITAIGPVHLERFGSLEQTLSAKSEILSGAEVAVLNVDDERLRSLAGKLRSEGGDVRTASGRGDEKADVALRTSDGAAELIIDGALAGSFPLDPDRPLPLSNVACAAAIALSLQVPPDEMLRRLGSLPVVEHRLSVGRAESGVVVLDDTYNSNPAGAEMALEALAKTNRGGRLVVVTPGMVELGPLQHEENAAFARKVAELGAELVVVGRTNRHALLAGGSAVDGARPMTVATREQAVAWVRRELGPGDAVLYENDLPDHFP